MKRAALAFLMLGLGSVAAWGQPTAPAFHATDADGKEWVLDRPGRVTVIIGNSPDSAQAARDCGKALDEFQGRPDFRALVVVDLRGSLAQIARGYTQRRMRRDLDAEAQRITPWYRKNNNPGNPRHDIGAAADFDGAICNSLQWPRDTPELRVVIFDKAGRIAARFEPARNLSAVRDAVFHLLNSPSSTSISRP